MIPTSKKIILAIIDLIKTLFLLSNLNKNESQGFISPLTKIRLTPYTKVRVPYCLGRTVRGLSFDENLELDPAARMCKDLFDDIDHSIIQDNLFKVFTQQKDMNAADIVNLNNNVKLKDYPAWAIVMPWEELNIEDVFKSFPETFYKNRISQGMLFEENSRLSIIDKMYTVEFARNRVEQMNTLCENLKYNGYVKDSNFPKINILINKNEWRWFMGDGGNHRSYVFYFFGHKFFNARVSNIINKKEVHNWHNVKNGTYSVEHAENIFDSYFDGCKAYRGMV